MFQGALMSFSALLRAHSLTVVASGATALAK